MPKFRTKAVIKLKTDSGHNFDITFGKGADLVLVICALLEYNEINIEAARSRINKTLDAKSKGTL